MARPRRQSTEITRRFAKRLSLLVEEKKASGATQKEIAADIGISSGGLSEYCADIKTPTVDMMCLIAKYFDVQVDYLLGLSDKRTLIPVKYTVEVISKHTVDVEAYSTEEAIEKACGIAWEFDADEIDGKIIAKEVLHEKAS